MTARWSFYADEATRRALRETQPSVVLVGSFMGYPNFGDILQLKGALRRHRAAGREPLLVIDIDAPTDAGYLDRVRRNFGVRTIVLASVHPLLAAPFGWERLESPPRVPTLHLYGGGFLNPLWGEFVLSLVEGTHAAFGVERYVVSGQQVDPAFAPAMQAHFARCPAVLAGGRDPTSAQVLAGCGVPAGYSFDDAAECMADLAASLSGAPEHGSHALVHLNASGYTRSDDEAAHLETLRERLTMLRGHVGSAPFTLAQAYTDRRTASIVDTLGVVQLLDETFPLREYRVLHLDRLALDLDRPDRRLDASLGTRPTIALSSSYHVSMLAVLLGVPCWMERRNAYYHQKCSGLALPIGEFAAFLAAPQRASLDGALSARRTWLDREADVWVAPAPVAPAPRLDPDPAPRAWSGKRTATGQRDHLMAWAKDAEASAARAHARATELAARIASAEGAAAEQAARAQAAEAALAAANAEIVRLQREAASLRDEVAGLTERHAATRLELDLALAHAAVLRERVAQVEAAAARVESGLRDDLGKARAVERDLRAEVARLRERAAGIEDLCDAAIRRLRRLTA